MYFGAGDFDPCDVDWEREGNCIAENTHLTALTIGMHPELRGQEFIGGTAENIKAFYRGVARNRSIKHLSLDRSPIDIGDVITVLSPFLEHNRNLRHFEVATFTWNPTSRRAAHPLTMIHEAPAYSRQLY